MPSLKTLLFSVATLHFTNANPLPDVEGSSTLVRRATPSDYPITDDGAEPCQGEWKYLNFDTLVDSHVEHLKQLHAAFCDDLPFFFRGVGDPIEANDKIFPRYFTVDDDEDTQDNIQSVFDILYATEAEDGQEVGMRPLAKTFIVDNIDFNQGVDEAAQCDDETYGYTAIDDNDGGREKTHFCPLSWDLKDIFTVQCDDFDSYASEKMDTLSRVVLHEMMHYSSVGPDTDIGQIIDANNQKPDEDEPNGKAYGPARAHGLIDPDQDDNPGLAEINADNYAWLAVDAYFSFACGDPGNPEVTYEDPPDYDE